MVDVPQLSEYVRGGGAFNLKDIQATDAYVWCTIPKKILTVTSKKSQISNGTLQYWVITSPNTGFIPRTVIGPHAVCPMADGKFGLNDRTLHPQYYLTGFEYMCCIPRHPKDPNDMSHILWYMPRPADAVALEGGYDADVKLFRLQQALLVEFAKFRDHLNERYAEYNKIRGSSELLGLLRTSVSEWFNVLKYTGMHPHDIVTSVTELQRALLDLKGLLDYIIIYAPRLHPEEKDQKKIADKMTLVNNTIMGAFTEDAFTAMQLFDMGIPVWLLRPYSMLPPDMMVYVEQPETVDKCIVFKDYGRLPGQDDGGPYPVVYEGYPGSCMN
ncbi:hypothetical protein DXG01_001544 [Tephrocybe rancida]|nr:hypothetical protein DXG01_001544 [Tephrocybe rancida]